jgi:hypothetical protein
MTVQIGGRALNNCGQATKGAWGMSWRQKTKTGVEDCEKSGVVVKQTLIPVSRLGRSSVESVFSDDLKPDGREQSGKKQSV